MASIVYSSFSRSNADIYLSNVTERWGQENILLFKVTYDMKDHERASSKVSKSKRYGFVNIEL